MPSQVLYEVIDGTAELTLNHPPSNALSDETISQLLSCLERARTDPTAFAVLLRSSIPRRFCAGLDLKVLDGASADTMQSVLEKLYWMPSFVLANRASL